MKNFLILSLVLVFLSACNQPSQLEKDIQVIQNYLIEHNIDAIQDESGLFYSHLIEGDGLFSPGLEDTVIVKYAGYLTSGVYFDKTIGEETKTFALERLLEGWQLGLPLMKRGGKTLFLLPSDLGYGSQKNGIIPANSVLIFEIELIDFY
jgi:FKBP-type peptidyl-prolyl cis-trans isomerase FkpA